MDKDKATAWLTFLLLTPFAVAPGLLVLAFVAGLAVRLFLWTAGL